MTEVVLQRVVLPWGIELPAPRSEILSLYVNPVRMARHVTDRSVPPDLGALFAADLKDARRQARRARWDLPPSASTTPGARYTVAGRRALEIEAHGSASFDTYFNRVHAGYLRRWTALEHLTLRLSGEGQALVSIRHSTPEGRVVTDDILTVTLSRDTAWEREVSLKAFAAGGSLWFDLESTGGPVSLHSGEWVAHQEVDEATIDVAVCTYDRPRDVLRLLQTLRRDDEFLAHVANVWVVDHGSTTFADLDGSGEVRAAWGSSLRHIRQPNLGGSGGFSRGMHEAAQAGDASYVFLMDDDVLAEPESLRRAVVFAELATIPIAVGGHMLNRQKPTQLPATGEWVNSRRVLWESSPLATSEANVDRYPLDRVVDVAYNAWWACLIPLHVVRDVGLALPMFIKWDDVEYGLRMARHGVTTVTLPGVAVWHESWDLKDAETDWTLYFFIRNRLIAWAMLSAELPDRPRNARLQLILKDYLLLNVLRNVARRSFSSVHAVNMALEDFLRGPAILDEHLDEVVARVRAGRRVYPGDEPATPFGPMTRAPADPRPKPLKALQMVRSLGREFGLRPPWQRAGSEQGPADGSRAAGAPGAAPDEWEPWRMAVDRSPVTLPDSADHWWALMDHADAIVVSVDGGRAVRRPRDPAVAREVTRRFVSLARTAMAQADSLSAAYSGAQVHYRQPEAWEKQWSR